MGFLWVSTHFFINCALFGVIAADIEPFTTGNVCARKTASPLATSHQVSVYDWRIKALGVGASWLVMYVIIKWFFESFGSLTLSDVLLYCSRKDWGSARGTNIWAYHMTALPLGEGDRFSFMQTRMTQLNDPGWERLAVFRDFFFSSYSSWKKNSLQHCSG